MYDGDTQDSIKGGSS